MKNFFSLNSNADNNWTLVKKTKMAESFWKFEFTSNVYKIKTHLYGVNWFGKFFLVKKILNFITIFFLNRCLAQKNTKAKDCTPKIYVI